jgi:hypothetical protein
MSTRDLLIFMAVITAFIGGITGVGWYYFHRWYVDEKTNGKRHIDATKAQIRRDDRNSRR